MACATLKRSLDWENLSHRPSKRRRCNPFDDSTSRTTSAALKAHNTAAAAAAAALMVRDTETKRLVVHKRCNPFAEANVPVMTTEKMSQNICDEIKRLHKRKQLPFTVSALEHMNDSESSGSEMLPESSNRSTAVAADVGAVAAVPSTSAASRNSEKPLFTFKQVRMICERMLKEREEELCEKYDSVLTTKLAEQYDMFVKFTYDQIQKRYESAPSYLS